jgi:hypothetical protein
MSSGTNEYVPSRRFGDDGHEPMTPPPVIHSYGLSLTSNRRATLKSRRGGGEINHRNAC